MQPPKNCIGPIIHIGREILCLPYAGFFILKFVKGYVSTKGIFAILTINAPKWRRSAGTWKFSSNATFSSTEAPLD